MRIGLRTKITTAVVACILFFGLLGIYSVNLFARNILIDNEQKGLQLLASQISNEVGQVFDHSHMIVETIADRVEIKQYLDSNKALQDPEILNLLEEYNIGDAYSAIYLMAPDGTTLVSTNPKFTGNNYAFRTYFQKALAGEVAVDVVLGVTSKELGYYFAYPVKSESEELIGVVIAKMKPEFIHEASSIEKDIGNSGVMLVDNLGVIVYSDDDSRLFHSLGLINSQDMITIEKGRRFEGVEIIPEGYDSIQSELELIKKETLYEIYDQANASDEILAVAPISKYPFFLILEEDLELFTQIADNISKQLILFISIAALLAGLLVTLIVSKVMSPLVRLRDSALQFAKGKYSTRVGYEDRSDEIGELARAFDQMISNVMKSKTEIEKKITDRTSQLEKLNRSMIGRELKMVELKEQIKELERKSKQK